MNTLKGALLEAQFDNVVLKAGTAAMLGLDGSTPLLGMNFDAGISGIKNDNPDKTVLESVAREGSTTDKVLKVSKAVEASTPVVISAKNGVTNAKEFTFEFDINIESANATTLVQIFFNSSIAKSPIDFTIRGQANGFSFGVLNSYSGGTTTNFGSDTKLFSYNKYYHVKLHVVIGDADSFTATLYVDGENLGTSNVFLNPEKKEGYQPSTQVNAVNLYYQKAAKFVMYIDNVSLTVKQ
jgi:hypothetical protein